LIQILDAPDSPLLIVPFDRHIAEALPRINRLSVPELPDRIIAATALYLNVPLVSRDSKIQTAGIQTVW
jgi:predicted nucleic acid-binding protein